MSTKYPKLFEPITIGSVPIKNRIAMAPMGNIGYATAKGGWAQNGVDYFVERAKGGTGLIITGICFVDTEIEKKGPNLVPTPTYDSPEFMLTSANLTERVHSHGAKIFLQLTGGFGRVAIPTLVPPPHVAPSDFENRWNPDVKCRAMTTEEVETLVKKFAQNAMVAKMSGYDGVEIHAMHEGYLIDQFTIALFNKRSDKYGGDLNGRVRLPVEIVQAIKKTCGPDFAVGLRYSIKSYIKDIRQGGLPGEEFDEMGRDLEEGLAAAKILEGAGYDYLNADAGSYDSWYWAHPPMYMKKGCYFHLTDKLKEAVSIPIVVAGRLNDPAIAEKALEEGKADMACLGRPLLTDPYYPLKASLGMEDEIRPCIGCQTGCLGRIAQAKPLCCTVNPAVGREKLYDFAKAKEAKRVVIVGGGVGGMEAARASAIRGHQVTLFEKNSRLGGNLLPGGVPEFKEDDRALLKWYEKSLTKLGVTVKLNTDANSNNIKAEKPDFIIIATGAKPKMPKIEGIGGKNVVTAADALLNGCGDAKSVVVVGGGLIGCEAALHFAQSGMTVTIVEALARLMSAGLPVPHANEWMLEDLLAFNNVSVLTGAMVENILSDGVTVKLGDASQVIKADKVVIAAGYERVQPLPVEKLEDIACVRVIGDAAEVRNIQGAIWDACEVAHSI